MPRSRDDCSHENRPVSRDISLAKETPWYLCWSERCYSNLQREKRRRTRKTIHYARRTGASERVEASWVYPAGTFFVGVFFVVHNRNQCGHQTRMKMRSNTDGCSYQCRHVLRKRRHEICAVPSAVLCQLATWRVGSDKQTAARRTGVVRICGTKTLNVHFKVCFFAPYKTRRINLGQR